MLHVNPASTGFANTFKTLRAGLEKYLYSIVFGRNDATERCAQKVLGFFEH
jgi:hypothetical protein